MDFQVFMYIGFLLAAYAIVANDSIQTLGTFISSNKHRSWWVIWAFASSILTASLLYSWYQHSGDVTFGRLSQIGHPGVIKWWHVVPPLCLIALTRFGIPVSTTFLVLSVFSSGTVLTKILTKSLMGYFVAFFMAMLLWWFLSPILEGHFKESDSKAIKKEHSSIWVPIQWLSTGLLWSQWLIQDFANIYVYLPRQISLLELLSTLGFMLVVLAFIMRRGGGEIQGIVTSKTNTADIRSASLIDFVYAGILFVFKSMSNLPMSTTWVFIGVLAGREFAIRHQLSGGKDWFQSAKIAGQDFGKACLGLGVSLIVALGVDYIKQMEKEAEINPKFSEVKVEKKPNTKDLSITNRNSVKVLVKADSVKHF